MDENQFEMAERLEQAQRERALTMVTQRLVPESHPSFDGKHCVSCDDEIPAGRLAMSKVRCVACQTTLEKRHAN